MAEDNTKKTLESDIARYKAMLAKDPSSTLFAALAESFRRLGQFDEAIKVSIEGLKIHPNHISAKVALARAYYDKKLFMEALAELEAVISAAPDNILAQRLLKDIQTMAAGRKTETAQPASVVEGNAEAAGYSSINDSFYTLTMAEILERQGFKKDAMKIYHRLLKKGVQNSSLIKERMERLK